MVLPYFCDIFSHLAAPLDSAAHPMSRLGHADLRVDLYGGQRPQLQHLPEDQQLQRDAGPSPGALAGWRGGRGWEGKAEGGARGGWRDLEIFFGG